jgi:hypothetical protein
VVTLLPALPGHGCERAWNRAHRRNGTCVIRALEHVAHAERVHCIVAEHSQNKTKGCDLELSVI